MTYYDIELTIGSDPEFMITCGKTPEVAIEILKCLYPEYLEEVEPDEDHIADRVEEIYEDQNTDILRNELQYRDTVEELIDFQPETVIREILEQIYLNIKMYDDEPEEIPDRVWYPFMLDLLIEMETNDLLLDEDTPKEILQNSKNFEFYISAITDELVEDYEQHELARVVQDSRIYELLDIINISPEKQEDIIEKLVDYLSDYALDELPSDLEDNIRDSLWDSVVEEGDYGDSPAREYFCSTDAKIGCDGNDVLGELRPDEKEEPLQHYHEIASLIKEINDLFEKKEPCGYKFTDLADTPHIYSGGLQKSYDAHAQMGGHIHIGYIDTLSDIIRNEFSNIVDTIQQLRIESVESLSEKGIYNYNIEGKKEQIYRTRFSFANEILVEELKDSFDNILKQGLAMYSAIPLTLIEKENERYYRHDKKAYGKLDASDWKPYGIEWRVPSSWLVSPYYTMLSLTLSYVVSYEILKHILDFYKTVDTVNDKEQIRSLFVSKDKSMKDALLNFMRQDGMYHIGTNMFNICENLYNNKKWDELQDKQIPYIYEQIKKFVLYQENDTYKEIIDKLFIMLENKETWSSDEDILPKWLEVIENSDMFKE